MATEEINRILSLIVGWGLAGIALLIGLSGLVYAGWNFKQDRASLSWPETTGKIISSEIDSNTRRTAPKPNGTKRNVTDYEVSVYYAYDIAGQAYESRSLRYGSSDFETRSEANKIRRRFMPGKKVAVYYDPKKPASAVLLRGTVNHWGQLIGFTICLAVGLALLILMLRLTIRKPCERAGVDQDSES